MKNHRIIKLGLVLSDKSDIKDYQIKIFHSLKKNKYFSIKLFKIDNYKQNDYGLRKFFILEKKFFKKNYFLTEIVSIFRKVRKISYKELQDYKKKDVDIFINLSANNISNKIFNMNKILWEIVYGDQNLNTFPICFSDILNNKPFTKIRIIEVHKKKFRLIDQGFFNVKNYAILNQEFILEKTIPILLKSLKLFVENKLKYKKINKFKIVFKKIKFLEILNYYYNNYIISKLIKKKYNWNIFISKKKNIFKLNNFNKIFIKNKINSYFADPFVYNFKRKKFIFFENFSKKKK